MAVKALLKGMLPSTLSFASSSLFLRHPSSSSYKSSMKWLTTLTSVTMKPQEMFFTKLNAYHQCHCTQMSHFNKNQIVLQAKYHLLSHPNLRNARIPNSHLFLFLPMCLTLGVWMSSKSTVRCDSHKTNSVVLGNISEFQDGEIYEISVPGGKDKVILANLDGRFYCVGASCTHYSAPLQKGIWNKQRVVCPWHDAEFDLKTGKCVNGPTLEGIPTYEVFVKDGKVYANLPVEMKEINKVKYEKRDKKNKTKIIIVGGGTAAISAAETLRTEGFTGEILMLSKDTLPPYDRPVLTKNLQVSSTDILLRSVQTLEEDMSVEIHLNTDVVQINLDQKTVRSSDGKTHHYDKLILCTGSIPRKMNVKGDDATNIFAIRTYDDAQNFRKHLQPSDRLVIVGSSFIGLEAAAACSKLGIKRISVIGKESVPFENVLGKRVGNIFAKLLKEKGIEYIPNASVKSFNKLSNGKTNGIELSNGECLQCDNVLVGVGAIPSIPTLYSSKTINNTPSGGLPTNQFLQLENFPDVYCAGDICSFPYTLNGEKIRIEHYAVAMQQGRVAAMNIITKNKNPYVDIPFFWSMIFGKSLRYCGYGRNFDDVIIEGDLDNLQFVVYYIADKKVVAVATMGRDPVAVAAIEALKNCIMPSPENLRVGIENSKSLIDSVKAMAKQSTPSNCCCF